ncbi:MAG: NAD-dependent epimerase/dehydratase family protein [Clostridia bacterium]|nr:NAD-dependent epimerase/dehydratase family protein [Clostridia bacterium]
MKKQTVRLEGKTVLVTGSPGFIGANLVIRLLKEVGSGTVISLDDMNDYYDVGLKEHRLRLINEAASASGAKHVFVRASIAEADKLAEVFDEYRPSVVVNLAAQAGVRYSIEHPEKYIESNVIGFFNILEACRRHPVEHLVYASSSSVYGADSEVPFSTEDSADRPVSLYAATKRSDELLAYSYSKLYDIPVTGLRFFTVYGPAGRPDMFYFSAAKTLEAGGRIRVFNYGNCMRDFTYIDDVTEGVVLVMQGAPERKRGADGLPEAPYAIYNIGGGRPENLNEFISVLHRELKSCGVLPEDHSLEDHVELVGMQPGDVPVTYADCGGLERDFGFRPGISIETGLKRFARWYADHYRR